MNEEIRQIAERLKGLRDVLEISVEDIARVCDVTVDEYSLLETGTVDIPVSLLYRISHTYGVELTTLMYGDEPKMNAYFVTRKGKGVSVERTAAYKYQSLAAGFTKRKADPFMVTVHPKPDSEPIHQNSHAGQEFNLVISGRMLIQINGKDIVLNEGDSIYFNSELPHGMKALDGKEVQFLAIIF
ncbi:MAG: cupin domain-containing protein [Tannerella sp.]|jgi:quercetin dioxygenase-like cupin family protein|nr:cupin domain-containing protein [Tannerella sp.]